MKMVTGIRLSVAIGHFIAMPVSAVAEDFTLRYFGAGPVTLQTTITYEGAGERLVASARNESGAPIEHVKFCVLSPAMKGGCLFEMWNTVVWEPGEMLHWNATAAKRVPTLAHEATIEEFESAKLQQQPPSPPKTIPSPQAPPVNNVNTITNETIIKLSKAGLGDDVIIGMINNQPGQYSVTPNAVIALKEAGVSDNVLAAIVSRPGGTLVVAIPAAAAERSKVYVSDSNSWSVSGGFSASNGSAAGHLSGGASPQTVEIIKTFGQRCPDVIVTMDRSQAGYVVLFDREGGKGVALRRDKIAVFKKGGDVLFSGSTRSVGSAVQDSCGAIQADLAAAH
jgi:hypothetical protein